MSIAAKAHAWTEEERRILHDNLVAILTRLPDDELRDIVAEQQARLRAKDVADLEQPANLFRRPVTPQFSYDDVPDALARLARAWSEATGFDRSGILVAGVVAAAGAIDGRYRLTVRAKSQWFESACLWAVLLADPSGGKSPTLRAASTPIKRLHTELFRQWQRECEGLKKEDQPPKPALFTSDATVEALADILRCNPRGVLMLTEEFASWIGSLDAYRDRGGAGKDRGEWLQLYDGGPHQIDRVNRGSFFVPNWQASVLAACTPAGLRKQLRNLPEDGLIHRFLPCILRTPQAEQDGDAAEGLSAWNVRIRDIYQRTTGDTTSARARFARDAEALFDAEATELRKIVSALADAAPSLAAHVGKHPGMLARVALVFHVLDARPSDAIEIDTLRRAIQFMRCARKHANAMFGDILGASPTFELARALARSIVADSSRPASIGRNWMLQHCRQFKVAPGDLEKRAAIALLEDARWLAPVVDSRPYGGWQASEWIIDARVYDLFAAEGESHRARRAVVREAFLGG